MLYGWEIYGSIGKARVGFCVCNVLVHPKIWQYWNYHSYMWYRVGWGSGGKGLVDWVGMVMESEVC